MNALFFRHLARAKNPEVCAMRSDGSWRMTVRLAVNGGRGWWPWAHSRWPVPGLRFLEGELRLTQNRLAAGLVAEDGRLVFFGMTVPMRRLLLGFAILLALRFGWPF